MPSRSFSPPERTAARAMRTRNFEGILHDQNRFSYFLDYLSVHAQAHKLLFWFEIEQYKLLAGDDREMASHQETIFGKYFGDGARGGAGGLELPPYAVEHTEVLYTKARGRPLGYMFDVAQAFVYQELRDRWLPQFRSSSSHTALVDHLRMSYPVSLSQLLSEGPFNDCLNSFIYDSGECKADLRQDFQVWFAIHSTLRPLCAMVLQSLEKRGVPGSTKQLSNLEEEGMKFRDAYLEGTEVVRSPLDKTVKALLVKRIFGLIGCKPTGLGALGVGSMSGGPGGGSKSGAIYAESLRAAVSGLNDALLSAEDQVYRPLEEAVVPALVKSSTFGNFVDDLSSLECAPLQARLRLLNDWADVQRKLPDKAVESTAGGKTSHLLRPCPTPAAPDVWPVASSKAGGVFGGPDRPGRRAGRGRGARAGGGADVTCPSLLFVFQVDTEEATDGEENDDDTGPPAPAPSGAKGGAILGQAPRGLHGVAAIAATPAPGSLDSATKRAAAAATAALPMEGRGQGRRGSVRSPPRPSGPPRAYGSQTDGASRKASPTRSSPRGVPPGAGEGGGGGAGGRLLRRFRTKVRQMRHVIAARVLQDTPPRKTGGGNLSVPRSDSAWGWDGEEGEGGGDELDDVELLAGMASSDTNYAEVRSRLNGQILELMAANVTEALPRYCLPSAIARVEAKKPGEKKRALPKVDLSFPITFSSSSSLSSSSSESSLASSANEPPPPLPHHGERGNGEAAEAMLPRVHHFVMTVPRKRLSPSASPRVGSPSRMSTGRGGGGEGSRRGRREGAGSTGGGGGGGDGSRKGVNRQESDRRWAIAKAPQGTFPAAIDRDSNIVLHGACLTVWRKADNEEDEGDLWGRDSDDDDEEDGARAKTTAYVPRCVCALSFDPLFDTLRAVALARGGHPETARALMVGRGGGGVELSAAAQRDHHLGSSSSGGGKSLATAAGGAAVAGGGGGEKAGLRLEWGLGDAATLKAGRPPLPILPPPPPTPGPRLPSVFAPSLSREAGGDAAGMLRKPPPLVQSNSAPDSMGGWSSTGEGGYSTEEEGPWRGGGGGGGGAIGGGSGDRIAGGLSAFGLPPLVPLDHPVEPLFQALSSDNVLLALSALMCERPVLVTCSVRSLLSVAVSSLKALLHPLDWHHAYAPLLPAAEVVSFWKSKLALDKKTALNHGRSGSPPRITPGSWGASGRGGRGIPGGGGGSPPTPRVRATPFLVGLDGELVRLAMRKGGGSGKGVKAGPGGAGDVWGVASSEPCMVPEGAEEEAGASGIATTQPSPALLEVVRCMVKQSVHVDLDHDDITWPPPQAPDPTPAEEGGVGGTAKTDSLGPGKEKKKGGEEAAGADATGEEGGGVGAPPVWPEEAARRARRVVQSTLFPDFETFDVVSETPPQVDDFDDDDDSALFKCSGLSGGGAEASLRDKVEAFRTSAAAASAPRRGISGGAGTLTESIVGMYIPTAADLALRAAVAGLVASVLGRVKEFTTLFAQAGLMRFDTAGFVKAVATRGTGGSGKTDAAGGNSALVGSGVGGPSAASAPSGVSEGSGASAGGHAAGSNTADDEAAPVVVGAAAVDDGSVAEGAVGEGGLCGVPGTELCMELVRTRAFAALLSDEVFADVDLETVQGELRLHSRQIRKSSPS